MANVHLDAGATEVADGLSPGSLELGFGMGLVLHLLAHCPQGLLKYTGMFRSVAPTRTADCRLLGPVPGDRPRRWARDRPARGSGNAAGLAGPDGWGWPCNQ